MNLTPSHTWTLNITKQLLGWKSKAFEPVRNGQIYEYWQNPARHNPVHDKGTHLPRLRCLENLLHSCQHKKVMHAAIDLKKRLLKVEDWVLRVHQWHCAELSKPSMSSQPALKQHIFCCHQLCPNLKRRSGSAGFMQPCDHQPKLNLRTR